jgi:nucleotide-binding universal stress UspA family protein
MARSWPTLSRPHAQACSHGWRDGRRRVLKGDGLVCRRQVAQGDPAQVIIDAAGTDTLVVMATHGRSGLTRWALGSVADRVARHAAAAVLLVRARAVAGPHM